MKAAEIQNTPDACCPNCQRKMDKVFVADGSEKKIQAGDATLCMLCGVILEFTDDLRLIPIQNSTLMRMLPAEVAWLDKAQKTVWSPKYREVYKKLNGDLSDEKVEGFISQLADAALETQDALGHQRAAYEGKLKLLRSVIHDMAGAFARLNTAVEIHLGRLDEFSPDNLLKSGEALEVDRKASMAKFNRALDSVKW